MGLVGDGLVIGLARGGWLGRLRNVMDKCIEFSYGSLSFVNNNGDMSVSFLVYNYVLKYILTERWMCIESLDTL